MEPEIELFEDPNCAHYGIECESDVCRCQCAPCRDALLDFENEIEDKEEEI